MFKHLELTSIKLEKQNSYNLTGQVAVSDLSKEFQLELFKKYGIESNFILGFYFLFSKDKENYYDFCFSESYDDLPKTVTPLNKISWSVLKGVVKAESNYKGKIICTNL